MLSSTGEAKNWACKQTGLGQAPNAGPNMLTAASRKGNLTLRRDLVRRPGQGFFAMVRTPFSSPRSADSLDVVNCDLHPMKQLLRCGLIVASAAALALGVDFSVLKPQGYVSDFAGVIGPGAKAELERYCAGVEAATGAEIALVTLSTLAREPVEDVANLLYRKWGIGKTDTDEGILLLLVIRDERYKLEVGYGLEPYIPDGYAGSLRRRMGPALKAEQYGEAMDVAARAIGSRIAEAKGVAIEQAPTRRATPASEQPLPWFLLVGGLVMLLWLLAMATGWRGRRFGLGGKSLGRGMYGGYHARSGGGFGGFDSSDSFGGFGGGDSGGSGASGDW